MLTHRFLPEVRVAEEVAEVFKMAKELLAGVVIHIQDLGGFHVVNDEKGELRIRFGTPKGHYLFTGILDEQVVLIKKLHFPHPET